MMTHVMPYEVKAFGLSDIGLVRQNNEDVWAELPDLRFFVLADGMGGHQAGEIAARETVNALCHVVKKKFSSQILSLKEMREAVQRAIEHVNYFVYKMGKTNQELKGMGTTLCCLMFHEKGVIYANVGDSRIYRFRGKKLDQMTKDHSLLRELVDQGQLNEQQAMDFLHKNIITKAIGTEPKVVPSVSVSDICHEDIYLMCSDGLTDHLTQMEIAAILHTSSSIQEAVKQLVTKAKEKGGYDNVTVVVMKIMPVSGRSSPFYRLEHKAMVPKIYLDNNASTAVDFRVVDLIIDEARKAMGNPSSTHSFGQEMRKRLIKARNMLAVILGVKSQEIIFTSGGTEGINLIIRGVFGYHPSGHLITSNVEHACVYANAKQLEAHGCEVSYLSPGLWGAVTPDAVRAALRPNTRLITLMAVNNETGVKTDIEAIARIAEEAQVPFVVDGVALLGKELFRIPSGVSAMCFSGHKLHAPQGTGFAFIRSQLKLHTIMNGGDQEFGRRGGTENILGILALTKAVELLATELPAASQRMQILRDKFENTLQQEFPYITINGQGPRIVNTTNLAFKGIDGETLLMKLDREGIAASHGSACASGALEPSRVLLNMGIPLDMARSSIRFSLSRLTTEQEIDTSLNILRRVIQHAL
jgi:cysteine desulfurase